MENLILSPLGHTWILDLDGTLVLHNGYKIYGKDVLADGVREFFDSLPNDDMVVIITSRTDEYKELTESFLRENNIRFDAIIYNAPFGERILINDKKPSGLVTALAVNLDRDEKFDINYTLNNDI
jgi:hypothetical protein